MSKLLLSCDNTIYCHNNRYYAKSQDDYDFFQRYLRIFEELRIVCRCKTESVLKSSYVPLDDNRIEVVYISDFHRPKQYLKKYFHIGKELRNVTDGCDCAILRLPSTIAFRVGKKVMKAKMPYATEIVYDAIDGINASTNVINKLLWRKIDYDMRMICNRANGVSCVTEHYLQRRYYSKVNNCFSSNYSSLSLPKSFFTSPRPFPIGNDFIIAHVANQVAFNGRKGINEILQAINILKNEGIIVKVQFAGKDYNRGIEKLMNYARSLGIDEQVEFLGFVDRKRLSDMLNTSAIYVMPTKAEGLPRVIIEAMAKGLPCISTPVSGNPELLSPHFLVEYSDVRTLADRIKELHDNKDLYESTSKQNFDNSLKYEASILQKRRDEFYLNLKNCK